MLIAAIMTLMAGSQLHAMTQAELDVYIQQLSSGHLSFEDRLCAAVINSIGTEYADGPLGEGPGAKFDADPIVNLQKADCVTFVEQAIAVASSTSYDEMVQNLQKIRYKGGAIDYETRNHFMISDWIRNNSFCKDVTGNLGVAVEPLTRTISRKDFFKRVHADGLGESIPDERQTIHYVPSALASKAEAALPQTAIVVFVGKVDWLFALHCGLYLRDENGQGTLYHASSKTGTAVGMNLTDYIAEQGSRYLGFTAYEVTDPSFTQPASR